MHKGIALSADVETRHDGCDARRSARRSHDAPGVMEAAATMSVAAVANAVHALRKYLIDAADREAWDQQHMAELNVVIQSCVESLATNRRESQAAARLPLEAIRHAMGYVDEQLDAVRLD